MHTSLFTRLRNRPPRGTALILTLALTQTIAWSTSFAPAPSETIIVSPKGIYKARILSSNRWTRKSKSERIRPAQVELTGPEGPLTFDLPHPLRPSEVILFDDGSLLTFDGFDDPEKRVIGCYSGKGQQQWAKSLAELLPEEARVFYEGGFPSPGWRHSPLKWKWTDAIEGSKITLPLAHGDYLDLDIANGNSVYTPPKEGFGTQDFILSRKVQAYTLWSTRTDDPRAPVYREKAQHACEALLQKDPHSYEYLSTALGFYQSQKDHDKAVELIEKMIALPKDKAPWDKGLPMNNRTVTVDANGFYPSTHQSASKNEGLSSLYRDLGQELKASNHFKKAEESFRESLRLGPREEWWVRQYLADLYYQMGRPNKGDRVLGDYYENLNCSQFPRDCVNIVRMFGHAYATPGTFFNPVQARIYFGRGLTLNSYDSPTRQELANLEERLGNLQAAIDALRPQLNGPPSRHGYQYITDEIKRLENKKSTPPAK